MKKIFIICLVFISFLPNVVCALGNYETNNLEETLKTENISSNLKNYSETEDQAIIYMFRGNGCAFCRRFLTFLESIVPEYGKYFKLVSFEIYDNKKNSKLMNDIAEFLETSAEGVPFIIIGDQVFPGYDSSYDERIKAAIKKQYDSKNSYDVMAEYENYLEESKLQPTVKESDTKVVVIFNLVFVLLSTFVLLLYQNHCNSKVVSELQDLKAEVRNLKKNG